MQKLLCFIILYSKYFQKVQIEYMMKYWISILLIMRL